MAGRLRFGRDGGDETRNGSLANGGSSSEQSKGALRIISRGIPSNIIPKDRSPDKRDEPFHLK
jgi:hypothetical protein